MIADTSPADHFGAGRTDFIVVASMRLSMATRMWSRAGSLTDWFGSTAGLGRIEHFRSTIAEDLLPDDMRTGLASSMTGILTVMSATFELLAADLLTDMILNCAALLQALVSATLKLLITSSLTFEPPAGHVFTVQFL